MTRDHVFADRVEAGRLLGAALRERGITAGTVLGLPRGGVVVAREVADVLALPLDVVVVRKLGAPANPEYAIGAVGPDGIRVLDEDAVRILRVSPAALRAVEDAERAELARRTARYRGSRTPLDLAGRTAILVDDGVATGATATAAAYAVRKLGAERVVLAVPVAPSDLRPALLEAVDVVVALARPDDFGSVSRSYRRFDQTTDAEIDDALARP